MAQEQGFVTSIREDGWAEVVAERKDACDDCGAKQCCVSFGSSSEMVVKALNRAGAKVGEMGFLFCIDWGGFLRSSSSSRFIHSPFGWGM
ncbi:hypothetical protein ES703_46284 [subsurface metagenome]